MDSKEIDLCSSILLNIIDNKLKDLNEIIHQIESIIPNVRVYIFEVDKNKEILKYNCNNKKTENKFLPENIFKTNKENINRVIARLKIQGRLIIDDINSIKEYYRDEYEILLSQNVKSVMIHPIIIEEESCGFIYVDSKENIQVMRNTMELMINIMLWKIRQISGRDERVNYDLYTEKLYRDIKEAINSNEFKFVYQPKFDMITNTVIGAEVLIRWHKKNGEIIRPDEFIGEFEEHYLIYLIDYYAIEESMKKIKYWSQLPHIKIVPISINVSKSTFMRYSFIDDLESLLKKYDIDPKYLEFEITEREYVEFKIKEINTILAKIKSWGIKIALDDFGSGNSNISFSMSIDLDTIKIDKSITDKIGKNKKIDYFLSSIIGLSDGNDLDFIVEGIENKEQCDFLIEKGYKLGQGYYYSKPIEVEELEELYLKI